MFENPTAHPAEAGPGPTPNGNIDLQRARDTDAPHVIRLLEAASLEAVFDPAQFQIARRDGEIVACGRLKPLDDGTLELASVAVREDLRGRGIGERLVHALLDRADRPVVALALAPVFFERVGLRRLDAIPEALRGKAEGFCKSSGFVPMTWAPDAASRIRERYARIARATPGGPQLDLGTGDPVAAAALQPGEVVLDLGSGAGADVIPAARLVGPSGCAIGIDFTPDMVERARRHAAEAQVSNARFEHGSLEALPLRDETVDVVISNCVINLSTDKSATVREAFRILKPGGRVAISDTLRLPGATPGASPSCDCSAGAMSEAEWRAHLKRAGFVGISLEVEPPSGGCCSGDIGRVMVRARKPVSDGREV